MPPAPPSKPRRSAPRRSLWARTRANFLTGLVIVAPVALTLWLIWSFVTFVDAKIVPLVPAVYNPSTWVGFDLPGFGLVVFVLFTAVVGSLTKNLFGRQIVLMTERWVDRMPVVRSIYNGVKQIIETVLSQSQGGASFQKACLVEYPRKGLWAVAFVSTETKGEIGERVGNGAMMSVFLPTTPNPTSGFLLFVPREDAVMLDMSVEEAAKLIISAGLVTPPTAAEKAAGLARRAAPARRVARRTAERAAAEKAAEKSDAPQG